MPNSLALRNLFERLENRQLLSTTFNPADGPALTTALTSAQLGDTIILNAGSTYTGAFTLPVKSGTGYITIQSSNLASLASGVRVGPADAVNMPKIYSKGSNVSAIAAAPGAHSYKLLGLEVIGPADNSALVNLVQLGTTDPTQDTLAEMPYDFVVDRCFMHANFNPGTLVSDQQLRRAIALNSGTTDITNCYISEVHDIGSGDSQAIGGANGSGPYNIINNHLEAASENILFGGSGSYIPNTIPSDVVIRGNHLIKPLSWQGKWAQVKNLFELKVGARILVQDNIFENSWAAAQNGYAILIKLDSYSASRPWQVTEDVTFTGNIVRHAAGAVTLQGRDYTNNSPPGLVRRLTFTNNLFDDIQKNPWASWNDPNLIGGNLLYMTHGPRDVTFDHNTFLNGRTTVIVDTPQYLATNFKFTNNITAHNTYGVFSSDGGTGNNTFTEYFNDGTLAEAQARFTKNILMGGPSGSYSTRPGNFFPSTWTAVGFVDQTNHNFRLAVSSPYHNASTTGTDLGADFNQVVQDFASMTGTALNVNFDADAPLPITLAGDGSSGVVATYDQTSITFSGVTAINVTGTAGNDSLLLGGTLTPAISFAAGNGNDSVEVLAGGVCTVGSDLSPSLWNVAVTVDATASATFNATQHLKNLIINGLATLASGGNRVLVTKALTASAGKLDLKDNDLVVDYGVLSPVGTLTGSAYGGITGMIQSGRSGGNGIITSLGSGNYKTLGVAEASQALTPGGGAFGTESVDGSAVLVKFTYGGDANLDGKLNIDDYTWIDAGVAGGYSGWVNGDFNYDGKVNIDDYTVLDGNIGSQNGIL
jgi:hypothetical protein